MREFERLTSSQANLCCRGVTVSQCHALLKLEDLGEANIGRLADALKLDKSTLSRTVDSLVKLGLVERVPDPRDRRYMTARLTPQGKRTCEVINKENDAFYQRVIESIPERQQEVVVGAIHLFVDVMERQIAAKDEHT